MKTHVTFVLDSSGSMAKIRADTIGGFNMFLEDQQDEPGEATVTLYDFNTSVERVYRGKPIENPPTLDEETYTPGGTTALYDAIATAIIELPNSEKIDRTIRNRLNQPNLKRFLTVDEKNMGTMRWMLRLAASGSGDKTGSRVIVSPYMGARMGAI